MDEFDLHKMGTAFREWRDSKRPWGVLWRASPLPLVECSHCFKHRPGECPVCAGTNRCAIPLAEVIKCR